MAIHRPIRLLFLIATTLSAAPDPPWTVARNPHCIVYSQIGEESARTTLGWFEQLRTFFLDPGERPPLRVVVFRSPEQYREYSAHPNAGAYYAGSDSRDYIVMPPLAPDQFGIAAHEYAHFVMHAGGVRLPSWLAEGIAEFYSTVRIAAKGSTTGAVVPGHIQNLRHNWIPLADLFATAADTAIDGGKDRAALFYSESWLVVHMMMLSPQYASKYQALLAAIGAGTPSAAAIESIYAKPLVAVERDARLWSTRTHFPSTMLFGSPAAQESVEIETVTPTASRLLLADVLSVGGKLDRAEALYREVPESAEAYAGLGSIALRRGNPGLASREWKRAVELGLADPLLCYRYAMIAQDAGVDRSDIRTALERAIALEPDFDDAHFALALLEMNSGNNDAAVSQFRAVKRIPPARAYGYWSGLAYTLVELDRRDEAKAAALEARKHASTNGERAHALELVHMAETDFAVRFTRDAKGRAQLTTDRAPHNQADWNPFIEPGDTVRRVEGILREIQCDGASLRITVLTGGTELLLSIADRSHVQMRNAPAEFTCGIQPPRKVAVDYATPDIVRGIEFR